MRLLARLNVVFVIALAVVGWIAYVTEIDSPADQQRYLEAHS